MLLKRAKRLMALKIIDLSQKLTLTSAVYKSKEYSIILSSLYH